MADSREDPRLLLIDPDFRGLIPISDFHIPKRLRRTIKNHHYSIKANSAFREIIELCGQETDSRHETWINNGIIQLYDALHRIGHAHSVEVWEEGKIVGGLYGVSLGAVFFGESMFSLKNDTSKIALVHLVAALKFAGFRMLDAQFHNSHLEQFGLYELPRDKFIKELEIAILQNAEFPTSNFAGTQTPNLSNGIACLGIIESD